MLQPITLMLLDFQMPYKNGIEVVKDVRELYSVFSLDFPHLVDPNFVFLTGFMTTALKNHLLTLGIDEIYEKPLSEEKLK